MSHVSRSSAGASTRSASYSKRNRSSQLSTLRLNSVSRSRRYSRSIQGSGESYELPERISSIPTVVLERAQTSKAPRARLILVPTAHVSSASADDARRIITTLGPDVVVLELCDERIDGVLKRLKYSSDNKMVQNTLVPRRVRVNGLPSHTLPGVTDESTLLARLRTSTGVPVSEDDIMHDATELMNSGLFRRVQVHVSRGEVSVTRPSTIRWRGGTTLEVPVSEIVFTVEPVEFELTSDIQFRWDSPDCLTGSYRSEQESELEIVRRAGTLIDSHAVGASMTSEWESGALRAALLIAVNERLQSKYIARIVEENGAIIVCINRKESDKNRQTRSENIDMDLRNIFSVSHKDKIDTKLSDEFSLSTKIVSTILSVVESSMSAKVEVQDGEEIAAALAAAFEARTRVTYLADRSMSETFKSFDQVFAKNTSGKKRMIVRLLLKSLWSLIAVQFQSQMKVRGAIETERLALASGSDVQMAPYMREVFIDQRDDVLFDCFWKASVGVDCHKPCFIATGGDTFEYLNGAAGARAGSDSECITIVGIIGAAHVPGIIHRWNIACAEL